MCYNNLKCLGDPHCVSEPSGPGLAAAVSSSLSQNIADVVGQAGAAPLNSLQIHFIQNMIHETLEDFRCVPTNPRPLWARNFVNFAKMLSLDAKTLSVCPPLLQGHLSQRHRQPAGGDGSTVLHPAGKTHPSSTIC